YTQQTTTYLQPIDVRPLLSLSLIKTGGPVVRDPAEAVAPIKKPAPIPVKSPAALPVKMPEKLVESSSHGIKVIAPPGEKITPATVVTVAAPPEIITPAPAVQLPKPLEKAESVTQMRPVEPAKPVNPVNPPRPMEHSKTTEAVKSANVTTGIASAVVKLPELPKQPETGKSAEPVKSVASAPSEVIKPVEPAKPLEQVKPVAPIKQVETVKKPEPVVPAGPGAMRPLAIMIENHNQSRPQSGLDQADLVYEMPVEGGITRFMAVYTRLPGLIGPVRSCREYFVDRALEVDALYVHCGGSPLGYAYISKSKINSVDEIKHSKPFFRDKTRKAPHNLYAKGGNIYDYMSETISMRLASQPVLLHYGNAAAVSVEPGNSVKIKYHGNYTLEFKLENGAYQRYMNNDLHVDRETGLPLRASAVVVQVASMKTVDKVGRQEISFIGSGTAWILQNGVMTPVKWHKSSPQAFTSYKDAAGNEYVFPKGLPVWVQVVSPLHKLVFNGVENNIGVAEKGENKTATSSVETGKQG
ncbi:MAG: DUF3048 domain-containing protein, partial [Candidatus Riflebacteria bacterium]|nr:DUF3048 domain-containing protein [Candidatus Riflebacteria bacterium]